MFLRLPLIILLALYSTACQQAEIRNPATTGSAQLAALATKSSKAPEAKKVIFQSLDGGSTWQDISAGLPSDLATTTVYAKDGEIYLGTFNGLYVNRTPRPAAPVWQKEHLLDLIDRQHIIRITPDQDGPIVQSLPSHFFHCLPGSGLWKPTHQDLPRKEINATLTTRNGARFATAHDGIYRSPYGGNQWGKVFTQGMVLSLIEVDGILLGAGEIGVLRSDDGGDHWTWVLTEDGWSRQTTRIGRDVYAFSMGGGNGDRDQQDLVQTAARLRRSSDVGLTWEMLDRDRVLGQRIYDLQASGDTLYCSSSNGLFRSVDQGVTWTLIRASTSERAVMAIAVDGQVIYATEILDGC